MTTNDITPESPADGPQPAETEPVQDTNPQDVQEPEERPDRSTSREAAKYRRQLRDVEAERDRLTEALTGYRRADVERAAEAAGLARGADLLDVGTELATLLNEDGTVDEDMVRVATATLLAERPHWGRPRPLAGTRPVESLRPGASPVDVRYDGQPDRAWQQLLNRGR